MATLTETIARWACGLTYEDLPPDAVEAAKLSEVTIYTVGFTGWGPDGSYSVNRPFLTTLAEATVPTSVSPNVETSTSAVS